MSLRERLFGDEKGTSHWWMQRVTSVLLIPLVLWCTFAVAVMADLEYTGFVAWLQNPLVAIALLVLVLVSCYHGALGLRVIVEDYVQAEQLRHTVIALIDFSMALLAAVGVAALAVVAL